MNSSSTNNSFSFNQDQVRMPVKRQLQFMEIVRKKHVELKDLLNQQKNQSSSNEMNSNEELFADIEKARDNQNSSGDSQKDRHSITVDRRNTNLEKAIDQFNDSRLLILSHCDQEIYNDENIQVEEQQFQKSTMMDDINEVFSDKNRFYQTTPTQAHRSVPPTSSSLQATPENKKGYGRSILSTEISNEPESQTQYQFQTQSRLSMQSNSSEQFEANYNQHPQPYQPFQSQYQQDYYDYQCYQDNQHRKRRSISDEDSHMFIVNHENIGHDSRTTMMIKNIPNKYTIQLLLDQIDKNHQKTYDFIYLPIDFKNHCNMGYAFVNFVDIKYIKSFYEELHGKRWPHFNSEKICVLRYARIQGRQALIQHFQFSSVMNQKDKKLKPVILPQSELSKFQMLIQRQQQNQKISQQFFQQ